jgi:hypothetical protein
MQNWTGRTGRVEQKRKNMTSRTGQANRTGISGRQAKQDLQTGTGRTEQAKHESENVTGRAGQADRTGIPILDKRNVTGRTDRGQAEAHITGRTA